jgi:hypothetical protein
MFSSFSSAGVRNWSLAPIAAQNTGPQSPRFIETCKLTGVDPQAYLTNVITRIVNGHPQNRIDEHLPWAYAPTPPSLPCTTIATLPFRARAALISSEIHTAPSGVCPRLS